MSSAARGATTFPAAAGAGLADQTLRANLARATGTIRARRTAAAGELPDWEELRERGRRIKDGTLARLDEHLLTFEAAATDAGATVHWARDADEANATVIGLMRAAGFTEAVKVKSLTTDEIGLNDALTAAGMHATETDLAELILQLDGDWSSHILVPAIHRNRHEIGDIFRRTIADDGLTDEPADLAEAARLHLRRRFLETRVGICGANFAVAETGSICILESEGNGRMCTTLPRTLIAVVGIEKLLPRWDDLSVMLQLLPRSSTGERMNPYTSVITGVSHDDGPQHLHIVLLDNGRSAVLADPEGRDALRCIRCSACLNVCPVYQRTGGHAYGSIYPGPIGAILTPQLDPTPATRSLPYASTLCGACYAVCPVKIDIPRILVHLRSQTPKPPAERAAMRVLAWAFGSRRRFERLQRVGRRLAPLGNRLPGPAAAWRRSREMPAAPQQSFREWWHDRRP
jgi:L-lactate dehydrogenase complex protein LldF